MEIGWIMFAFFLFITVIFLILMFLLPEWFGITGKKAKEILREQQGDSAPQETNSSASLANEKKSPTEQ